MPRIREYICCICKQKIHYKPIRLVKQMYGLDKRYSSQYSFVCNYNFCNKCYKKFHDWVMKHGGNDDE